MVQKLTYREYWGYYWRITHRHSIPGIVEWDRDLVDLVISSCTPPTAAGILDVGCAGGDQAIRFARKGYHVTGIDQVPSLIAYATEAFQRERLTGRFLVADFREMEFCSQFDLCVMLSGTFGAPTPEEDLEVLKRIHLALKPGGRAFIDYLPVEKYSRLPRAKTWYEFESGFALAEEWYHVPTSTWRTRHRHVYLDGRLVEAAEEDGHGANEIIRCYSAPEIEHAARSVGFNVKAHLSRKQIGNMHYAPQDDEPRGMVVLEKKA